MGLPVGVRQGCRNDNLLQIVTPGEYIIAEFFYGFWNFECSSKCKTSAKGVFFDDLQCTFRDDK